MWRQVSITERARIAWSILRNEMVFDAHRHEAMAM